MPVIFGLITNPRSRLNQHHADRFRELQVAAGEQGEVAIPWSLAQLADALDRWLALGVRYIIVDGGDGTLHVVLRSLQQLYKQQPAAPHPMLLPAAGGSFNFVARYLGNYGDGIQLVHQLRKTLAHHLAPEPRDLPCLDVRLEQHEGQEQRCFGFAVAAAGAATHFYRRYESGTRRGVAKATRSLVGMLASEVRRGSLHPQLLRTLHARVVMDERQWPETEFTTINAAAIPVDLKLFRFFPKADQASGMDVILGRPGLSRLMASLPRMVVGRSLHGSGIYERRAQSLAITALGQELFSPVIDGEIYSGICAVRINAGSSIRFGVCRPVD